MCRVVALAVAAGVSAIAFDLPLGAGQAGSIESLRASWSLLLLFLLVLHEAALSRKSEVGGGGVRQLSMGHLEGLRT